MMCFSKQWKIKSVDDISNGNDRYGITLYNSLKLQNIIELGRLDYFEDADGILGRSPHVS